MKNRIDNIPEVLLMGPGPSSIPEETYRALRASTLGHLDPEFIEIMDDIKDQLRKLLGTQNRLTMPVSGTGSAGMEACFVNLVEPGDRVLVCVNGVFGTRMAEVASRLGAQVDTVEADWGTPIDVDAVRDKVKSGGFKIVAIVHAETSTGVRNPVEEVAEVVREDDALYLVDGVTSLGGIPVELDKWGVDAFYSGTQKCLSAPPGLAPVSFSERAEEALSNRKSKVPNWYLDFSLITQYWEGAKRSYHHTAPVNMLYSLYQALVSLLQEGKEAAYKRHAECHKQLVEGLRKLGVELLVDEPYRLPMLNAVRVPDGVDEAKVRTRLRNEYMIEIGAGLGPLAGKVWRVGLMGHTAKPENVDRFLNAFGSVLK